MAHVLHGVARRVYQRLHADCAENASDSSSETLENPGFFVRVAVPAAACITVFIAVALWQSRASAPVEPEGLTSMAAGAAIWEWRRPAHLSAAAGIKRFAVAYVWSDPAIFFLGQSWSMKAGSFVGPYAHGRGVCALAASAHASRSFLQEAAGPGASVDAVVLTDGMDSQNVSYLLEMGIRVLHTNLTSFYEFDKFDLSTPYHADHQASFFKLRASTLKAGLAALTDYEAIFFLDVDAYFYAPPDLETIEDTMAEGVEFLSYRCLHAPLAVGNFILKPSQEAFSDMMDMLSTGFTPERGWGLRDLRIGQEGWHLNCDDPGWESKAYCADRNTSRWDFLGAEGDKGLLFTEYSVIRRSFRTLQKSDYTRMTKSYNFFGPVKPWMPIERCEILSDANHWNLHPIGHIPQFWDLYEKYSRSKMKHTEPLYCVHFLDRSLASFRLCLSAVHI